ncbi:hypothetical protein LINGRAHAP2_LOCUS32835 [Linum grandiflorum]
MCVSGTEGSTHLFVTSSYISCLRSRFSLGLFLLLLGTRRSVGCWLASRLYLPPRELPIWRGGVWSVMCGRRGAVVSSLVSSWMFCSSDVASAGSSLRSSVTLIRSSIFLFTGGGTRGRPSQATAQPFFEF